jgi:hypothetical protein
MLSMREDVPGTRLRKSVNWIDDVLDYQIASYGIQIM